MKSVWIAIGCIGLILVCVVPLLITLLVNVNTMNKKFTQEAVPMADEKKLAVKNELEKDIRAKLANVAENNGEGLGINIGGLVNDIVSIIGHIVKSEKTTDKVDICMAPNHPVGGALGAAGGAFALEANFSLKIQSNFGNYTIEVKYPDPEKKYVSVQIN
jgi:hypothetical protein